MWMEILIILLIDLLSFDSLNSRTPATDCIIRGSKNTHVLRQTTAMVIIRTNNAPIPIAIPMPNALDDSI